MRYLLLVTVFLVGCPTQQQIEDEEQFRKEYKGCLKDRVELIDKISVMKVPPKLECPSEVKGVLTPELDKAAIRDKCLYIVDRFGDGTFEEKSEAFRKCWDRVDDSYQERAWTCERELVRCELEKEK